MGFFNKVGMKAKAAKEKYDKLSNELDKRKTARLEKQARNLELKAKVEKQRAEVEKYKAQRRKNSTMGRPKPSKKQGLMGTGMNLGVYSSPNELLGTSGGSLWDSDYMKEKKKRKR